MLFSICCWKCTSIIVFSSFFVLVIVFVVGIILSSNWCLFLVFHMCVSTVMVSVRRTSFLVFGVNNIADIDKMCCSGV